MIKNKKVRTQWAGEALLNFILYFLTFYFFIKHDNFRTIILLILIYITALILDVLRKKCIIYNILPKDIGSGVKIILVSGSVICVRIASYARYKTINEGGFYFIFFTLYLIYTIWEYKEFIKS
ncbi:hypothetical protein [Clostridium lundense]|uniref:hypothetical protein n=1 Tax=Clostridium lundense TaxID=319475 RepID=UPI0004832075|nr:hypothetical protein [Clostridium lundense]